MYAATITLLLFLPVLASAQVVINEIAWMGTAVSANDEWIELYNSGSALSNLEGWTLQAEDGSPNIVIDDRCANTAIAAGGYYVFERTDDDSVSGVAADCIYTGALGNTGELLRLKNASGSTVDTIDASGGWPGGDNTSKETMQRTSTGAWITAQGTPRAVNVGVAAQQQSSADTSTESDTSTNAAAQTGPGGGSSPTYVPPEKLPRISVYAGRDIEAVVGEEVSFYGEAYGFSDELLENARYLWNFGDADVREGQRITHVYAFPGTYTARLHVSSGMHTALDDITVTISKNSVTISEVLPGAGGWVELHNAGAHAVHAGGWAIFVRSLNRNFILPAGMVIAPRSYVVLLSATTYLPLSSSGDSIGVAYPNGAVADTVSYVFQVPGGKSISRVGPDVFMTSPTPGEVNEELPIVRGVVTTETKISVQPSQLVVLKGAQQEYADTATKTLTNGVIEKSGEASALQSVSRYDLGEYAWLFLSIGIGVCAGGAYALVRRRMRQRASISV